MDPGERAGVVRVLIAYRSRYGTAEECAGELRRRIHAATELADLRTAHRIEVSGFDAVIVGGSIYGGRIQRQVTDFCEGQREELEARPVALYLCCLHQGALAEAQLRDAFPGWLLERAFAAVLPGGALHQGRLSFLDRLLVRGVTRGVRDVSFVNLGILAGLADQVNAFVPPDMAHQGRQPDERSTSSTG
jgi:menaquinone-dependent protoporphyrinogen oxidase